MSRKVHSAPLALTSDGTIVVNVTEYRGVLQPKELLEMALADEGSVFIGIELGTDEVDSLFDRLGHGVREAVALGLGARNKRRRMNRETE